MEKCFKMVDDKQRVLLPAEIRLAAGISRNDVVQVSCCGNVILINKATVQADSPLSQIQSEVEKENMEKEVEKDHIRSRLHALFSAGVENEEIIEEIVRFLV